MEYKVSCNCGIGETKKPLVTHVKEHQTTTRVGKTEKSTWEEHAWAEQHHPKSDENSVIKLDSNINIFWVKEALYNTFASKEQLLNGIWGTVNCESWKSVHSGDCLITQNDVCDEIV